MSKKHCEAVAAMFREHYTKAQTQVADETLSAGQRVESRVEREAIERCIWGFANVASSDNPRFDRSRFAQACGLP